MNNISDSQSAGSVFGSGKNPDCKNREFFLFNISARRKIPAQNFNTSFYSSISLSTSHSAIPDLTCY